LTRRRRGLQQVLEGTVSVGADIDRHIDRRGRLQDWGYWWLRGRGLVAKNERNNAE
jgi:hypothetical protein